MGHSCEVVPRTFCNTPFLGSGLRKKKTFPSKTVTTRQEYYSCLIMVVIFAYTFHIILKIVTNGTDVIINQ